MSRLDFNYCISIDDLVFYSAGNCFDSRKLEPIKNGAPWINKPTGGYWASPVYHPAGWSAWLDRQEKEIGWTCPRPQGGTFFRLKEGSRVAFLISPVWYDYYAGVYPMGAHPTMPNDPTIYDYLSLAAAGVDPLDFVPINFSAMAEDGFDAVYCEPGFLEMLGRPAPLHAWDCSTLLVFNSAAMCDVRHSPLPRAQHVKTANSLFSSNEGVRKAVTVLRDIFSSKYWRSRFYETIVEIARSTPHKGRGQWLEGMARAIYGGVESGGEGT